MKQQMLLEPRQQGSARAELKQKSASSMEPADSQPSNYGIPEWIPRVAGVLLPSPKLWKNRRQVLKRSYTGWNWQFIVPALLLMLVMQSLFLWQLYSPITAPLVQEELETEIEIEIPIDLSTLITESDPESGSAGATAPASQAAQTTQAAKTAQLAQPPKPQAAPIKPAQTNAPAQIIESPAASVAKAVVTAPSLAVKIPMSAAIAEPAAEQAVQASEGLAEAEKIAPMLERAEQNIDAEITLTPISSPITPEIAEPIRPAVPIAIDQDRPSFETVRPVVKPTRDVKIDKVSVVTLPERVETGFAKPIAQKPALTLSEPTMPQQITEVRRALIPAQALVVERPDRSSIAAIEPETRVLAPALMALAKPSIALAEPEAPVAAQSDAAQVESESTAPEGAAGLSDPNLPTAPNDAQTSPDSSGSDLAGPDLSELVSPGQNSPSLDLYGGIAQAAADQAGQNATRDSRNAFRRYDDPFVDDQPNRLKGLRLREPQLFLDIAKFLVKQLRTAGVGYALVQLGANEEINDFTDADLGPLIRAWTDMHHGDLTAACRQNNPNLSPEMRDVLCGTNN